MEEPTTNNQRQDAAGGAAPEAGAPRPAAKTPAKSDAPPAAKTPAKSDAPPAEPSGGSASGESSDAGGGSGPGGDRTGSGEGGAPKRRRRGRRGGKRHRKRPAGEGANGANGDASEGGGEGGGEPSGSRPAQQRRPAPRAEKKDEAGSAGDGAEKKPAAADAPASSEASGGEGESAGGAPSGTRPRRRRGGRGRGGSGGQRAQGEKAASGDSAPEAKDAAKAGAEPKADADAGGDKDGDKDGDGSGRRRGRRGGRGSGQKQEGGNGEQKQQKVQGSTRLAARAQRKQQQQGSRRRPPRRLTDAEAKALRGGDKVMLVHEHDDRTQIAVLEDRVLIEHFVAGRNAARSIAGNIYLGRVQNVLAGMEAAFVDIGEGRNAVLYAGEVNYSAEDLEGEAPRIERVLKSGQAVLVQVTKDAIGSKGARLTAQLSLPGRYCVLAPDQSLNGISRRLSDKERQRLRDIVKDVRPKDHGVIVRTAADGASKEAIKYDVDRLVSTWEQIGKDAKEAKAPSLIYSEPELVLRVVRDLMSEEFQEVIVDTRGLFERIKAYLAEFAPDSIDRLKLHEGRLPIFEEHHVTEQIHKALERKVWLPSGGSIVIDRTEAMTVVDVNTGKFVGKSSLEETVLKANLEAAEELARQLRLRDIGGIIVVDFIDMLLPTNREQVLRTLKRALGRDKTRSQVFEVSSLGLVEMTRKRVSEGLVEAFSEPCPNCEGRGIVLTHEID